MIDYGKVSKADRFRGHLNDAIEQSKWLKNSGETRRLKKQLTDFEAQSAAPPTGEE